MNIKFRFAILFTIIMGGILLLSSLLIYFLYQDERQNDFYNRLRNEATNSYHAYLANANKDSSILFTHKDKLAALNLYEEEIIFLDANGKLFYKHPDSVVYTSVSHQTLEQLKLGSEYKRKINEREYLGVFLDEENVFVFISAIDRIGLKRLVDLRYILFIVFTVSIIITAFLSFFYVEKMFRPLTNLSNQMEKTTALNLTEKIDEKSSYEEVNQIARNFNAMRTRLNFAFENQKAFVHNASHELRTPLSTMLSQTEAALNRNLDANGYKAVLRSLKEDQSDLIELTNSLLLISQYEKIIFSYTWPTERVDELLYEVIVNCKRMFADIELNMDFEELPENENDLYIRANDALLKSAFRNLIKNGYYYSDDKKVTIVIRIDKPFVEVSLRNTGAQMSVQEIDKMTMPFFRGKNAMQKKGYGLGLAIASKIVELHQGQLTYLPMEKNINNFVIRIPIA